MVSDAVTVVYSINAALFGLEMIFFAWWLWGALKTYAKRPSPPSVLIATDNLLLCLLNLGLSVAVLLDAGRWRRADGVSVNIVRWLVYTVSCGLLAHSIGTALRLAKTPKRIFVYGITVTLFVGEVVTVTPSERLRIGLYVVGCAPYAASLYVLWSLSRVKRNGAYWWLVAFIAAWTIYPVFFVLGTAMYRVVSTRTEELVYAFSDWPAKVALSVFLWYLADEGFVEIDDEGDKGSRLSQRSTASTTQEANSVEDTRSSDAGIFDSRRMLYSLG